jgi:molybdopterin/thiamine biosynthesis adenylyltransferase
MQYENVIRVLRTDFEAKRRHFEAAGNNESQTFTLYTRSIGPNSSIRLGRVHVVPDPKELRNQSSVSIEPTRELQTSVYCLAHQTGMDVGDEHTHPFTEVPCFSGIDDHHGTQNAIYLTKQLPEPATMLMTVFGRDMKHFQARVWNRQKERFEPVHRLEVIGSPMEVFTEGDCLPPPGVDPYARHRIIPGWEQGRLEKLKVLVVGLGGNGAVMWQSLVGLGVGRNGGWLKGCDADLVEASNLPRIPYAFPNDIGTPKATIAELYARHKTPDLNAVCYRDSITSEGMQQIAKESNVIIGAIDNDGGRKIMDGIAIRHLVVYLDLSTEIIPAGDSFEAVGQVRVVLPGTTGCLTCLGMIDPTEAALDLLPEAARRQRAHAGYVRGSDETPTPSVSHLNGVTAHLAISQFLRVVFGEAVEGKEFLQYDRQNCEMIVASCPPTPGCPVCGTRGYLGAGDEDGLAELVNTDGRIGRFSLSGLQVSDTRTGNSRKPRKTAPSVSRKGERIDRQLPASSPKRMSKENRK